MSQRIRTFIEKTLAATQVEPVRIHQATQALDWQFAKEIRAGEARGASREEAETQVLAHYGAPVGFGRIPAGAYEPWEWIYRYALPWATLVLLIVLGFARDLGPIVWALVAYALIRLCLGTFWSGIWLGSEILVRTGFKTRRIRLEHIYSIGYRTGSAFQGAAVVLRWERRAGVLDTLVLRHKTRGLPGAVAFLAALYPEKVESRLTEHVHRFRAPVRRERKPDWVFLLGLLWAVSFLLVAASFDNAWDFQGISVGMVAGIAIGAVASAVQGMRLLSPVPVGSSLAAYMTLAIAFVALTTGMWFGELADTRCMLLLLPIACAIGILTLFWPGRSSVAAALTILLLAGWIPARSFVPGAWTGRVEELMVVSGIPVEAVWTGTTDDWTFAITHHYESTRFAATGPFSPIQHRIGAGEWNLLPGPGTSHVTLVRRTPPNPSESLSPTHTVSLSSGEVKPLPGFPPRIIAPWFGKALPFWSPDGRYLAVQVPPVEPEHGAVEATGRELALYDAATGLLRRIPGPEGLALHWITSDTLRVLEPASKREAKGAVVQIPDSTFPAQAASDGKSPARPVLPDNPSDGSNRSDRSDESDDMDDSDVASSITCTIWHINAPTGERTVAGACSWPEGWRLVRPASCDNVALLESPLQEKLGLFPLDAGRLLPLPSRWERASRRYSWAPGAGRVGYVAENDFGIQEHVVGGADGTVARLAPEPCETPTEIWLSPDGRRAAVLSWVQGKGVVHKILGCGVLGIWDIETGRVTVIDRLSMLSTLLVSMRGGEARPTVCWTPDSRSLVYYVVRVPLRVRVYKVDYAEWAD